MGNANHPKAGSTIKVEPITKTRHVKRIKDQLANQPRNLAIFVIGINTNLRASDLIALTVGQVRLLQAGEHFTTKERKTGKARQITINKGVYQAVQNLLAIMPNATDDHPLFQSRKGGKALTTQAIHALVKLWCKEADLKGNYGSHTMRKTFGYMHRTVHHTDIPTLMVMFNHSSEKQTLDYLGIQRDEIKDAYLKEI
ncbi:MAG: tyrosine-type recombinase/integrase [Deltaproteobacteria bacterium]|nr:tyrosine-type recombinase/integrase [Deltaproteobacteria bacterium]